MLTNPYNVTDHHVQPQLEGPLPWIGLYVALASMACSLAMAADLLHGLLHTKLLWFPSKYFSLNATSLALLAVAVKLPLDLTTDIWDVTDRLAKLSNLALMSVAAGNFQPSIGSLTNKEILTNTTALAILVITVVTNVCIQVVETRSSLRHRTLFAEEALCIGLMLLSLALLCSSCVMITTARRYMATKYKELHNVFFNGQCPAGSCITRAFRANDSVALFKIYWLMAETSSPQFLVARSATCTAASLVCVLNALILVEAELRMMVTRKRIWLSATASGYRWSTSWIVVVQTIAVIIGTIAPAFRCCIAVMCKGHGNIEFKVEAYWTRRLKEAKGGRRICHRHKLYRKVFHYAIVLALELAVRAQGFIVIFCKLILRMLVCLTSPFVRLLDSIRRGVDTEWKSESDSESESNKNQIRQYALRLQGETELPLRALKSIYSRADRRIEMGRKQIPRNVLKLLRTPAKFHGVAKFDSDQVPSLHFPEPPNCWSLPVVTLTSIAMALPSVAATNRDDLLNGVTEGLMLVKLVEKCLCEERNGETINIRKAAYKIWAGVETCTKWQETDLSQLSLGCTDYADTLKKLRDEGQRIVSEFKSSNVDSSQVSPQGKTLMQNPLNWPAEVIAANSMYRISETTLLHNHGRSIDADEDNLRVFDDLCCMIADILAACLTNLFKVMIIKCCQTPIQERMESVRQAAVLLGQTEQILELLGKVELPVILDPNQAANIEEWRSALIPHENTIATPDAVTMDYPNSSEFSELYSSGEMAAADPHVAIAATEEGCPLVEMNQQSDEISAVEAHEPG